jgi:hypothetical protein
MFLAMESLYVKIALLAALVDLTLGVIPIWRIGAVIGSLGHAWWRAFSPSFSSRRDADRQADSRVRIKPQASFFQTDPLPAP